LASFQAVVSHHVLRGQSLHLTRTYRCQKDSWAWVEKLTDVPIRYLKSRGRYSRNEIAWVNAPAWKDGRLEPYVFLNVGKASLIATPGFPTLVGIGAGLRGQWQWRQRIISGELTIGQALTQPATLGSRATLGLRPANIAF
jgi:hypothetical protein